MIEWTHLNASALQEQKYDSKQCSETRIQHLNAVVYKKKIIMKCTTINSTSKFAVIKMLFALACCLLLLVSIIFFCVISFQVCTSTCQAGETTKDADPNIVTAVSDMLRSLLNVELLVMWSEVNLFCTTWQIKLI